MLDRPPPPSSRQDTTQFEPARCYPYPPSCSPLRLSSPPSPTPTLDTPTRAGVPAAATETTKTSPIDHYDSYTPVLSKRASRVEEQASSSLDERLRSVGPKGVK